LACSISSASEWTGRLFATTSTKGKLSSIATGERSVISRKGRRGCSVSLIAWLVVPTTSPYPSGVDFAIASTPIVPARPGRFSATTDCPRARDSRSATSRATVSVEPPGE
jgi:hypothetical protein